MNMRQKSRPGFASRFARLAADTSGNMMMIMAIAFLPVAAMVGSAFDIGRAYMVKTRLQQACDAGALAGRRAMTGKTLEGAALDQANDFFKSNFTPTMFGTSGRQWEFDETEDFQVEGWARATVPMTIMRMFDSPSVTINVECEAILEVANTDIMFVLDVTGSMNCDVATTNSDCSGVEKVSGGKNVSKIEALRGAVVSFYNTLNVAINKDEARLRFGFVPYSTSVNVGYSLDPDHLKSTWSYQSRVRRKISSTNTPTNGSWPTAAQTTPAWSGYSAWSTHSNGTVSGSGACVAPATTVSYGPETSSVSSTTDGSTGVVTTTTNYERLATETSYKKTYTSSTKNCKIEKQTRTRTEKKTDKNEETPNYDWDYKRWELPADQMTLFKEGSSITLNIGNQTSTNGPGQPESFKWDGCIEETKTVANATFTTIPSDAFDLNIDLTPDSEEKRWAPAFKEIIWLRGNTSTAAPDPGTETTDSNQGSGTFGRYIQRLSAASDRNVYACPKAAQKLKVMSEDDVKAYVSAAGAAPFKGDGYTYHDVGMIWGARFISPDGIFSDDNSEVKTGAGAGKPINRHIVFMTDGQMDPDAKAYSLYGVEYLDRRINTGSKYDTENASRHTSRFRAVCEAAKAKNITIWVVAYASTLSTDLSACATPGKASTAANDAQLKEQFEAIAAKIAELRVER